MTDIDFGIHPFTDHYSIHFVMYVPQFNRSPTIKKQIRAIKSIDPAAFSADVLASPLYSVPPSDLQSYSTLFSTTLSSLLDKHAPLKTISCTSRPNKPFLLLLKFFVKKLNVPNLNQFIAAVKPNEIRSTSKINPNSLQSLSLHPNGLFIDHKSISTRIILRNSGRL